MYGNRSPTIPIVLAYASGLALPVLIPFSLRVSLSLFTLAFLPLLWLLLKGVPYSQRHLPALLLLSAWAFAGMSAKTWESRENVRKEKAGSSEGASVLSIGAFLGKSGSRYRYRAISSQQGIPLLLELEKGSAGSAPLPGDRLVFQGVPEPIAAPKGPAAFDRKAFYADRGIHFELTLSPSAYRVIEKEEGTWDPWVRALRWRELAYRWLRDRTPLEEDELAVASALWLGRKTGLPDDLRNKYADAGGMHVLAVSGLHVGIVYLMFLGMLHPLKRSAWGRSAVPLIIVVALWAYALMTGWSSSVVRAVLMFSLYTIGQSLERSPRVGNAIAGSALIVLLFDPSMIEDIGFLLSYSAVIAIVTLYPLIERLWRPRSKLLSWLWSLLAVSFSAQLGVLPIVLAVFGEFPLWFELTNPLLLPLATIALYCGLFTGLSSWIPGGPEWMGKGAEWVLKGMNAWVGWIAGWPGSGVKVGPLGLWAAILLSAGIGALALALYGKIPRWSMALVWSVFLIFLFVQDLRRESKKLLMQHAGRDPPVTALRSGERVILWSPDILEGYRKRMVQDHWREQGVRVIQHSSRTNRGFSCMGVKVLYWHRSSFSEFPKEVKWDMVLLGEELQASGSGGGFPLNVDRWVVLGDRSMLGTWKKEGENTEKDLHLLSRDGAYIAPL